MQKDGVYMNGQNIVEVDMLSDYLLGKRTSNDLSIIMGVSERSIRRKAARLQKEGVKGLLHKNRGKEPANKSDKAKIELVAKLIRDKYYDFNIQHTLEYLQKEDGISISYSSLRRIMHRHMLMKHTQRRRKKARKIRDRMPRFGMMLQMDGSHHAWNGKDKWCLIGAIDDATSTFCHAEFFMSEDTLNCMTVMQKVVEKYGIPEFIYTDRAGIFGGLKRQEFSQFKRACEELGIKLIFANSPEAKGRIERAWRTLQDRLSAELRLKGIQHIPGANKYLQEEFLPKYWNKELTVEAEQKIPAFKKVPEGIALEDVFCIKESRIVAGNTTISIDGEIYAIKDYEGSSLKGKKLSLITTQNLETFVVIQGRRYDLKLAISRAETRRDTVKAPVKRTVSQCDAETAKQAKNDIQPSVKMNGRHISVLNSNKMRLKKVWTKSLAS